MNTAILAAIEMNTTVIAIIVVVVVLILAFVIVKSLQKPEPRDSARATPPEDAKKPSRDLLEDRVEVDAPVEITDDMSLAEIKRAKSAKIKGDKGRRETATEATAKSREEHTEAEESEAVDESAEAAESAEPATELGDVSSGWEDMLEDESLGLSDSEADEAKDAAEEAAEGELAAEAEPVEAEPVEAEPVEAEPVETEPVEAEPVEAEPVEAEPVEAAVEQTEEAPATAAKESEEEHVTSLKDGLAKTRTGFISRLGSLFKGDTLDEEIVDEVEEVLFTADIGPAAAQDILAALEKHLESHEKENPAVVWAFVREHVEEILKRREGKIDLDAHNPFVILVIGVNGVGKTTTIGKLASQYKRSGKSVLMVAGDTFRAAAVEQLGVWGERTDIPVHQGESDADPASVIYSGIEAGVRDGYDVIICDTAGRLHTKSNLLDELRKIGRVAGKVIDTAPHETILVLDANTGQNAIQQAKLFSEAVDISGIVLTKLDGTAKGGVILGICEELDAPIHYIGIGEGVADLRHFDAAEFVEALFM